jgi:hypothetical protein
VKKLVVALMALSTIAFRVSGNDRAGSYTTHHFPNIRAGSGILSN